MKKLKDFLKKCTIVALLFLTVTVTVPDWFSSSDVIGTCAIPDNDPNKATRPLDPVPYN